MNAYNDLTRIKQSVLEGGSSTTWDTELLNWLITASRMIDNHCNRTFYVETATKYWPGSWQLFIDDILSVTSFKLDEDGDGTFEITMAATDYQLHPFNRPSKDLAKIDPNGNYSGFASGIPKGVEIIGSWGYGDGQSATPYVDSGDDLAAAITSTTATTFTVDAGTNFGAGQTILIDSEQMYIESISSNTLTIKRGVNGTTAATHTISTTIYIFQYPALVEGACLIQAVRWHHRRESGYQDQVATEMGVTAVGKGLDKDVKDMLAPLIKRVIG